LRIQTRAELVELHARLAATIVYVTHDQVEAMTMGHRIAVMDLGVLQQVGPPQLVYDRPANLFVAGFLGSPAMNIATGPVVSRADDGGAEVGVRLSGGMLELSAAEAAAARADGRDEVVVGVRPEDLALDDQGPLSARVAVVEDLGHERHVACRFEGGELWIARLDARAPYPRIDEPVHLSARRLHLFSPRSGTRLVGED
jgi:multiple sugar transport system ATP-binding protein